MTLRALPPTPLETQSYWLKETGARPPRAPAPGPAADSAAAPPGAVATVAPVALEPMLDLFQQQMALLQTHLEVVKAHAAAVVGGAALD